MAVNPQNRPRAAEKLMVKAEVQVFQRERRGW